MRDAVKKLSESWDRVEAETKTPQERRAWRSMRFSGRAFRWSIAFNIIILLSLFAADRLGFFEDAPAAYAYDSKFMPFVIGAVLAAAASLFNHFNLIYTADKILGEEYSMFINIGKLYEDMGEKKNFIEKLLYPIYHIKYSRFLGKAYPFESGTASCGDRPPEIA